MAPAASHRTCKGPVPSHDSVAAAESYAAADPDSSKYSVLIFLNVFPDVITSKERRVKTVVGKLGLNESMWKVDFADAQVVDFVACGVAPRPGTRHDAVAHSFPCVTFVLIETKSFAMSRRVYFCAGDNKLKGYSPSSVVLCNFAGTRSSFAAFADAKKVGLHVFMHMLDYPASLVAGLERAIRSHETLLFEKSVSSQCRKIGVLKTHWDKLVAFEVYAAARGHRSWQRLGHAAYTCVAVCSLSARFLGRRRLEGCGLSLPGASQRHQ